MKYTWDEYQKIRQEHYEEMECLDWLDAEDFIKVYNTICNMWQKNPNGFCVTLSRPLLTLEGFKVDMEFWQWLQKTFKDKHNKPIVGYYPAMGMWNFYKRGVDLVNFNNDKPWQKEIVYNIKTVDVWEKGVEIEYNDGTKCWVEFDEVELKK